MGTTHILVFNSSFSIYSSGSRTPFGYLTVYWNWSFSCRFAGRFSRRLGPELLALRLSGAVTARAGRLQLTERGYYLWVMLMREFFSGVNHFREQMRHNIASERAESWGRTG